MQLNRVGSPAIDAAQGSKSTPAKSDNIRIAQMNLWNFFDTQKPGGDVLTPEQYAIKLAKVSAGIKSLGLPDVISVNEVENEQILTDLAATDALKGAGYKSIMMPTNDARGINVGFLYKDNKLEKVNAEQYNPRVQYSRGDGQGQINPTLLYARAPLVVDFKIRGAKQATDGSDLITLVTNHFKSKIDWSGTGAADKRREMQGDYLGKFLDERKATKPTAATIVMGDLNSLYGEAPFEKLTRRSDSSERFFDAPMLVPETDRYTYIYKGQKNMLDHLMISAGKKDAITAAKIIHVNQPNPYPSKWDPSTVKGFSDHDPMYADFNVESLLA